MSSESKPQKGPGVIGLTPAGQSLDCMLSNDTSPAARRLVKFICKFTVKCSQLRKTLNTNMEKEFIYKMMRDHYFHRLDTELKDNISQSLYSCTKCYISSLTRVNFVPNTKTQESIRRKAQQKQGVSI